jgi:Fe-S cluster assembly ATP-binding protein
MTIMSLRDVTLQRNGREILQHLSIDFWEGHVHALIGPNGAGKSTMAHCIMGLQGYTEFEGEVLFEGQSLKGVPVDERARRGITLAWQEPARFEGLSVDTFIRAGAKDKSLAEASFVLEEVGLAGDEYLSRAVDKTLSGGERKRIELASILAMRPKFMLMDEPDSGIDVDALNHIFDALKMLRQRGTTVVMITHSLTVLQHADHAFLMCSGRLVDKGSVSKIAGYFERKCIPCKHQDLDAVGPQPSRTDLPVRPDGLAETEDPSHETRAPVSEAVAKKSNGYGAEASHV